MNRANPDEALTSNLRTRDVFQDLSMPDTRNLRKKSAKISSFVFTRKNCSGSDIFKASHFIDLSESKIFDMLKFRVR